MAIHGRHHVGDARHAHTSHARGLSTASHGVWGNASRRHPHTHATCASKLLRALAAHALSRGGNICPRLVCLSLDSRVPRVGGALRHRPFRDVFPPFPLSCFLTVTPRCPFLVSRYGPMFLDPVFLCTVPQHWCTGRALRLCSDRGASGIALGIPSPRCPGRGARGPVAETKRRSRAQFRLVLFSSHARARH